MANLTFIKDAAVWRIDVDPLAGTFVVGEFFTDNSDSSKLGEVIAFTDDLDGTGTIDYILVGSNATQFANTDQFTGDGGGTGTVNSVPTVVASEHVHVIQVDAPATVVGVQELVNGIRDYEDELINFDHPRIANPSGKIDLGGGVLVGITLELLDNWRVQFEARPGPVIEAVAVQGGNLVAFNDFSDNPVKPSPFVQVTRVSSSSTTIAELEITDIVHRLESLRESHTRFGKIIYWNPTTGLDINLGDAPIRAKKTFAGAIAIADDYAGDVIMCLTEDSTGDVEVDEQIDITVNSLSVRGPGGQFHFHDTSGSAQPTVKIRANNVSLEGLVFEHATSNTTSTDLIHIDGSLQGANNFQIVNCAIKDSNDCGIRINDSADGKIVNCALNTSTTDGICLDNNVTNILIEDSIIIENTNNGINCDGTSISRIDLINNEISNNGTNGVRIGPNTNSVIIRDSNYIYDNTNRNVLEEVGSTNIDFEDLIPRQQAFSGSVHLSITKGSTGTEYPRGTVTDPVNNISDAMVILSENNLDKLTIEDGTIVVTGSINFDNIEIAGKGPTVSRIVLADGTATTEKTIFSDVFVGGTLNGNQVQFVNCAIGSAAGLNLNEFNGSMSRCAIVGNINCKADGIGENAISFVDCYTAGNSVPTIDLNGDKPTLLTNYSGSISLDNHNGTTQVFAGLLHGNITIESGMTTTSDIIIEGLGNYVNNSAATVDDSNLITKIIQDNNDDPSIFV